MKKNFSNILILVVLSITNAQLNANCFNNNKEFAHILSYNDSTFKRDNGAKIILAFLMIGGSLEIEPINKYYIEIGATALPNIGYNIYFQNKYSIYSDDYINIKPGLDISYFYSHLFGTQKSIILYPCVDFQYKKFGIQLMVPPIKLYNYDTLGDYFLGPIVRIELPCYLRLSYKFRF